MATPAVRWPRRRPGGNDESTRMAQALGMRFRHGRPAGDARRAGRREDRPARAQAAAPPAPRQAGDLPVDAGRPFAGRFVRLQAAPGAAKRRRHSLCAAREPFHARGRLFEADGADSGVPPRRRVGADDYGHAAPPEPLRGRPVPAARHGSRQRGARSGGAPTAYRRHAACQAVARFVDRLRTGHGKPQPAGLRDHRAEHRRRRRQRAVVRQCVPAGGLSGNRAGQLGGRREAGRDRLSRRPLDLRAGSAPPTRPDPADEPRPLAEARRRQPAGRRHRIVRVGLPHAGRGSAPARPERRIAGNARSLRHRREGNGRFRAAMPAGAALCRRGRSFHPDHLERLGQPRQHSQGAPGPLPLGGQAHRRADPRPQGARSVR